MFPNNSLPSKYLPPQVQVVLVHGPRPPQRPEVLAQIYRRHHPNLGLRSPPKRDASKESSSPSSPRASRPTVPAGHDVPHWPPCSNPSNPSPEMARVFETVESQCSAMQQLHISKETPFDSAQAAPPESPSQVACPQSKSPLYEQLEAVASDSSDTNDGQAVDNDTSSLNCGNDRSGHPA